MPSAAEAGFHVFRDGKTVSRALPKKLHEEI
jgi:hypothetical protein